MQTQRRPEDLCWRSEPRGYPGTDLGNPADIKMLIRNPDYCKFWGNPVAIRRKSSQS